MHAVVYRTATDSECGRVNETNTFRVITVDASITMEMHESNCNNYKEDEETRASKGGMSRDSEC
jgi:hypothetical protein